MATPQVQVAARLAMTTGAVMLIWIGTLARTDPVRGVE